MSAFTDSNRWQGQGGKLLVLAPNSYGDTFERSRHLRSLTVDYKLAVLESVYNLMAHNFPNRVVSYSCPLPEFDYWIDLLGGFRFQGRPPEVLFSAPKECVEKYSSLTHPSIGVCFRAAEKYELAKFRSIKISDVSKIVSNLPQFNWVSLQYGIDIPSATDVSFGSWEELAGLIANLDAVVSVDTAPAYLGILQKIPTIVLLGRGPTSQMSYPDFREMYPGRFVRGIEPVYGGMEPPSASERFVSWVKKNPEFWKPENFWRNL